MHNFKELKVWKAGIEVSKMVFELTRSFPPDERFGLISQMTRAAVSIPSNIAEGCGRRSAKEFFQFLSVSLGSAFELETHIILAKEFNYISDEQHSSLTNRITEVQKMLSGLQKNLAT
jgi:four helix bundle protein